jgi:hypothetical protein
MHSVDRMQNFLMLDVLVYKLTTGIEKVNVGLEKD